MLIQAVLLFALGACLSGLLALAFCAAYARRTRRLLSRYFAKKYETSRIQLAGERDYLRARNAVETARLERTLGTVRDEATVSRIKSDLKEKDLTETRADLLAATDALIKAEARIAEIEEALQATRRELASEAARRRALERETEAAAERQADLAAELQAAKETSEEQRRRIAAMAAELESRALASRGDDGPEETMVPDDDTNVVPIDSARARRGHASFTPLDVDRLASEFVRQTRLAASTGSGSKGKDRAIDAKAAEAALYEAIQEIQALKPAGE